MGFILQLLGAIQLAIGALILAGGWFVGGNVSTTDSFAGGAAGMLLVGVLGGAFTMTITGLITIALGSIHNGVKRLERQFASDAPTRREANF